VNSVLGKLALAIILAGLLAGCAGVPPATPSQEAGGHMIQGGSFAGEGMMYFPLPPLDHKK
jgi:hypothetical protein